MNRVKGKKYPIYDLYKEYLILKNRITKSDKIVITSAIGMSNDKFTGISFRKLFVKTDKNYGFYRMKNDDFENWVILKQRSEKISRIKRRIS